MPRSVHGGCMLPKHYAPMALCPRNTMPPKHSAPTLLCLQIAMPPDHYAIETLCPGTLCPVVPGHSVAVAQCSGFIVSQGHSHLINPIPNTQ